MMRNEEGLIFCTTSRFVMHGQGTWRRVKSPLDERLSRVILGMGTWHRTTVLFLRKAVMHVRGLGI
jgi:hypothetical protein